VPGIVAQKTVYIHNWNPGGRQRSLR